jgi:hypothetical protein
LLVAADLAFFSDAAFELAHDADPTRRAVFDLTEIAAGAVRSFALPDVSTELAGLSGAQTFDGDKTFAGELEASGPVATIGTAPGTASYGLGTGATAAAPPRPSTSAPAERPAPTRSSTSARTRLAPTARR